MEGVTMSYIRKLSKGNYRAALVITPDFKYKRCIWLFCKKSLCRYYYKGTPNGYGEGKCGDPCFQLE